MEALQSGGAVDLAESLQSGGAVGVPVPLLRCRKTSGGAATIWRRRYNPAKKPLLAVP